MLPEFDLAARLRPVDIISPLTLHRLPGGRHRLPRPAPYAAASAPADPWQRTELEFGLGGRRFVGWYSPDTRRTGLDVHGVGEIASHRSRRHGRVGRHAAIAELALVLTGHHVALLTRAQDDTWETRARIELRDVAPELNPHDPDTLATLEVAGPDGLLAGGFGQLGLRDVRWVSDADGTPVRDGNLLLFSATHAGPGFFDTGHTGVWSFDPDTFEITHRSDLYFLRADSTGAPGAFGDHATHVVRHEGSWLVATSTWSDFDLRRPTVGVTLARTTAEVLDGEHLLAAEPLELPTRGLRSVGTWDPHLVHDGEGWVVAFVSASSYFRFHPAVATGQSLDSLALRAADIDRIACEGVILARLDPDSTAWSLLASDGPDSPAALRQQYPVFDLAMNQTGTIRAPHLGNIPWPNIVRHGSGWLMVTFDGTPAGGALIDYGTHGDVLVMVSRDGRDPASQPD